MRVLSFIPAFLLAAAGFVVAAPASGTPSAGAPSCVSSPTGGNANDTDLQPVISIIANATSYIQPLSVQLANLKGDSCTPDAVSGIVVQITDVVSTCVVQLQAAASVDLTGLDLAHFCATVYGLLTMVLTILNTLVAIVLFLAHNAVGTVQTVICNLLNAVTTLVGCLNVFVVASVHGVLAPVISLVCNVVELLLSIVVGLDVVVGSN
ncbi:hypothetical protein BU15DRAFT_77444 [Melanogaster broomeanus]|nr:hypothetical protein BU15DRAFT_77444 [Melanogaster broomeanus]